MHVRFLGFGMILLAMTRPQYLQASDLTGNEIAQPDAYFSCGPDQPRTAHLGCRPLPIEESTGPSPRIVCDDGAEFWFELEQGALVPTKVLVPPLSCSYTMVEVNRTLPVDGGFIFDYDREAVKPENLRRARMIAELLAFAAGQDPVCYGVKEICQDNPVKRALDEKARMEAEEKARLEAEKQREEECKEQAARERARTKARTPVPAPAPSPSHTPMTPMEEPRPAPPSVRSPDSQVITQVTHSRCDEPGGQPLDLCLAVDASGSMSNDMNRVKSEARALVSRITQCHADSLRVWILEFGQSHSGRFEPDWVGAGSSSALTRYLANYRPKPNTGVEPQANAISACGRRLMTEGRPDVHKQILVITDEGVDRVSTVPQYNKAELRAKGIEVDVVDLRQQ